MQITAVTEITNKLRREIKKMEKKSHPITSRRGKWTAALSYEEEVRSSPNIIRRKRA